MKFFAFFMIMLLISCNKNLPYDLQVINFDSFYSISDKNGYPILQEKYQYNWSKDSTSIKKLLAYSQNKIGFIVKIETEESIIKYVFIKPKVEQNYAELEVDYTVYTEAEYKKLNLKDDWVKIRY